MYELTADLARSGDLVLILKAFMKVSSKNYFGAKEWW